MMRFIMEDLPLTMDMIRQAVKGDKVYKEMNEAIRNEIKSKEASDYRRQDARLQTTLREWVVDLGHSAHQGIDATKWLFLPSQSSARERGGGQHIYFL